MGYFDQMASAPGMGTNSSAPSTYGSSAGGMQSMPQPAYAQGGMSGLVGNGVTSGAPFGMGQASAPPVASPVNPATLTAMYQHMLGRMPDQMATNGWTGMGQADVIQGIQNSPEYQQLHGLQTTPGVPVNGQPVAQPGQAPWQPGQAGQAAINTAMRPINYLSASTNPYSTGKEDYNTYNQQMYNASQGLGSAIRGSFASEAPPANLAQMSQTPAWRAMSPDQQFRAMNPGTVAPAQQQTQFQRAVSNITPYGAQYQQNVASNPLYQRQAQNPTMGQMFSQQRMMQTPQTQNMYSNLYGGLQNLFRQHQGQ